MSVKNAFPRYDDVLPMLEGFDDCSWKNDSCPSISKELKENARLILFCDYKDKELREDEEGLRYCLTLELDMLMDNKKILLLSDEIMEIKSFLDNYSIADFINMPSFDYDPRYKHY